MGVWGAGGESAVVLHEQRYHFGQAARANDIGVAGGPGFGVGICPSLPAGISAPPADLNTRTQP